MFLDNKIYGDGDLPISVEPKRCSYFERCSLLLWRFSLYLLWWHRREQADLGDSLLIDVVHDGEAGVNGDMGGLGLGGEDNVHHALLGIIDELWVRHGGDKMA